MESVPTLYRGIEFRSRLEAKWAVFFDRLKLPWAYEPFTYYFNGFQYTPDFLIGGIPDRLDNPNVVFCENEEMEGVFDIYVIEVKPHLDIQHARNLVNWTSRIQPGTSDSQIVNAWQLAAEGACVYYGVGGFDKSKLTPKLLSGIDFSDLGFDLTKDQAMFEGNTWLHFLRESQYEHISETESSNIIKALRSAAYYRFNMSLAE